MTTKLYRKVLAGTLVSATMLSTSLVASAEANPSDGLNGLTGSDLISGQLSSPSELLPVALPSVAPSSIAQSSNDTFSPPTDEEIRQQLLIDPDTQQIRARPVPSSGFLTPSAYGADWGDAFVGLSGVTGGDRRSNLDGSASFGMGFGNAVENVGVELSTNIISLDGFGEDGTIGLKLHRVFPAANNLALAVGWDNPIKWGDANDEPDTFYGVATQRFDLRRNQRNTLPLTVSLGVGTGAYRSNGAIAADDNAPNVFGSVGLRVIPQLSLNTSWTGSALGAAVSAAPFNVPLIFTAGVSDITDETLDGTRFHGSMGYSFSF
ncbi:MAG: hypothetical protein AAFO84_13515 [Cyanobacteria bacterium J06598_1]